MKNKRVIYTVVILCSFFIFYIGFSNNTYMEAFLLNTIGGKTQDTNIGKENELPHRTILYEGNMEEFNETDRRIFIGETMELSEFLSMKKGISITWDDNSDKIQIELIPYTLDYKDMLEIKEKLEYTKEDPYIRIRNSSFLLGIGSKDFKVSPQMYDLVPDNLSDLRIYQGENGYIIQRSYEVKQTFNSYLNVEDIGLNKLDYYRIKLSEDNISKMELVANYELALPIDLERNGKETKEEEKNFLLNLSVKFLFDIHD